MNIGILKADSVMPELQREHGDYSDMFKRLLLAVEPTLEVTIFDVEHGDYPANLDVCNGYVITGSKRSVYEDEPWIQALGAFVQRLHSVKKPLVGICFGHQLVAEYLGGKTEKSPRGWGVGRHETRLKRELGKSAPAEAKFSLLSSHQDQVVRVPEDGEIIAESDFCPIAGMRLGHHILTFQGHPEFSVPYARALLEIRRSQVDEATYDKALASFSEAPDQQQVAAWMIDFIARAQVQS
ncbi:MAG: GMP synthase [Proteobacteria bacterium]|nr:GMP synthase [Pseudomonadota bacterium]